MNPKRSDTPARESRRKYEEANKEKRRASSGNFQAMLPRKEFDEICAFLEERGITKVDFLRMAFDLVKERIENDNDKK